MRGSRGEMLWAFCPDCETLFLNVGGGEALRHRCGQAAIQLSARRVRVALGEHQRRASPVGIEPVGLGRGIREAPMNYGEFVRACAKECRCCPLCSPGGFPCDGLFAGGMCDRSRCICYDEPDEPVDPDDALDWGTP